MIGNGDSDNRLIKTGISTAAFSVALIAAPVSAQTANGQTDVDILTSVSITNGSDLAFGDFVPGGSFSRFRIDAATGALTQHGGDALAMGGTQSAAAFTISGTAGELVRITSGQNRIDLIRDGGSETMRVNRFRFDGSRNRTLDASGQTTYRVGGQLRIAPNQEPGTYRGTFEITVDYR